MFVENWDEMLTQVVTSVWSSMFEDEVTPVPTVHEPHHDLVFGRIHITGPQSCALTLSCTRSVASRAAQAMLGTSPDETSLDDAIDAFGEVTNVTGGTLKSLLGDGHLLSLPTVMQGDEYPGHLVGAVLVSEVTCEWAGEQITATVFLDSHAAHAALASKSA